MLPRKQSIFHLGEEGGAACHGRRLLGAAMTADGSRGREGLVVGLQILVHHLDGHGHRHHQQHGRHAQAANIVLKQMVRPLRAAAVPCSFLKACSLCRRELSPNKDVYMYRGDQGFCSEECRRQQILIDDARERRGPARPHSRHHAPVHSRPRKTILAVA